MICFPLHFKNSSFLSTKHFILHVISEAKMYKLSQTSFCIFHFYYPISSDCCCYANYTQKRKLTETLCISKHKISVTRQCGWCTHLMFKTTFYATLESLFQMVHKVFHIEMTLEILELAIKSLFRYLVSCLFLHGYTLNNI